MKAGIIRVSVEKIREALGFPDDSFIYGLSYDGLSRSIKFYVISGVMPEIKEGEALREVVLR